jgi:hypothetical protein
MSIGQIPAALPPAKGPMSLRSSAAAGKNSLLIGRIARNLRRTESENRRFIPILGHKCRLRKTNSGRRFLKGLH